MNLSQQKRERLLNFIKELKSNNSFDEKSLIKLNEIENELNSKKYGLVWEEHEEAVDVQMKESVPVFTEDKSKELVSDKNETFNFLLEGDNLHSLYLLEKTHKGKIDFIYIDPPYNTGNDDFMYDDSMIGDDDGYRHSKWISFMNNRLILANKLLKETGIICISIDDNEQSQLKLLCDEIFGNQNFLNLISVMSKVSAGASGGGEDKKLKKNIEYVLIYAKSMEKLYSLNSIYKTTELNSYIKKMKEDGKSYKYTSVLYRVGGVEYYKTIKDGAGENIEIKKVLDYEIKSVKQVAALENITEEEVYKKYYDKIMTTTNAQTSIRTRVWDATDNENNMYIASYVPRTGKNKGKTVDLIFMGKQKVLVIWLKDTCSIEEGVIYKKEKIGTYWDGFSWINVSKEGDIKFDNGKKPIKLIKQLLALTNNSEGVILDFFAGSGSCAHAVLDLNREDGGHRKFILCTNNENKICERVTYKRLENVAKGYKNIEAMPYNLKYFKTDFVSKSSKNLFKELTKHVKELIELEWGISIDKKVNLMVMTEDELDKIEENWDKLKSTIKSIYRARQVVFTGKQKQLFRNINNYIIPDYYFDNELKEVGENW